VGSTFEILTLPFVRTALAAGLLIAGMCSYLGVYVVLRRVVFVGIALAQLAAAGVALSFYSPLPAEVLALAMTLLGAVLLSAEMGGRYLPRDAGIGFAYATAAAASILLVAKSAQGEAHVLGLLFGNILTLTGRDIAVLAAVVVVVGGVHLVFAKEFLFSSFDPETARTAGYRVGMWNVIFDLTLAGAIAMAIHAAGALLVFSYLVQPAMVGIFLSKRLRGVVAWAFSSGIAAAVLGLVSSVLWDLPTGPTVVAVSSLFVVAAWTVSKLRARALTS
jgi:ABC-type Mn2+/Zn2+ transport system permease subunit